NAGNSLLDWLQRSPPRVAPGGFRTTEIKCPSAADAPCTCETSFGEQYLQAANRAGSRAEGEEDSQIHAAAGAGKEHPSPAHLRRRDGVLFHSQPPTAAGAGKEHPSPVHLRRRDGALFHSQPPTAAGAGQEHPSPVHLRRRDGALFRSQPPRCAAAESNWKPRAACEPLVSSAWEGRFRVPAQCRLSIAALQVHSSPLNAVLHDYLPPGKPEAQTTFALRDFP